MADEVMDNPKHVIKMVFADDEETKCLLVRVRVLASDYKKFNILDNT